MTVTPENKRQWTTQRKLAAGWFAALAAVLVVLVFPLSIGILRLFIAAAIPGLWLLAIYATHRRKWLAGAILALGLIIGVFALLPGRPIDPARLRSDYLRQLRRYEGARYVWGGENGLGIDCSGLVRRALINSHLQCAVETGNPRALRAGLDLWWHDCSALALRDQYRGFTERLFSAESINTISDARLMPGDMAVTSDGQHVLAYLGNQRWIEADPGILRVVIVSVPTDNVWFTIPVHVVRWTDMKGTPNESVPATSGSVPGA